MQLQAGRPQTPAQAVCRPGAVDRLLDPVFFRAMAEPTRARVLACLIKCARPCSVTEVAECCSVDFSVVTRHLATLARAGVLRSSKQGRVVWYEVDAAALERRFVALAQVVRESVESRGSAGAACGPGACCSGARGPGACCAEEGESGASGS
ncbi:MAG: metalloregulator ArsR/SmtB family transcription factor [Planctomycetota bacterium]|nr:metalloregulator ArsR/SmtB family transcription factor [Planctomycetota bacterium]